MLYKTYCGRPSQSDDWEIAKTTQYKPKHPIGLVGAHPRPKRVEGGNIVSWSLQVSLGTEVPSIDVNYDTEGVNDRKAEKTRTTLFLIQRT